MKVCVVSSSVFACPPPGYSGLEYIAWQVARGMAELGHDTYLVAPEGSYCPNVSVIPSGPAGQWDERRSYESYWKRLIGMDAVIDHSWMKWSYVLKQEGVLKAPVLGVLHAPVRSMYQNPPTVPKPCLVCISEDQARDCEDHLMHDCRVAYNGCDAEFYRSTGVKRTDRYLFLARFSTIKGPDIAIRVAKAAGVGLDLVGDTSITNEPALLEWCKANADGKQIRLIGGVSRAETVHWFSQAKALLHPNKLFKEPFGLAPVEAQLCGCPVIGWNRGAMRETVRDGETGYLVKSEEEMTRLVREDAVSSLSRDGCREWAERFSVGAMVRRYEALCKEALETGGW